MTRETAVYLQGLMIEGPRALGLPCNVVHLDPAVFQARLPDRDRLMEQDAQLRRVEKVLATLWRDRLIAAKRVATPEVFVARCFRAATMWGHVDLFNDVPVLPEGVLQRVVGYPRRDEEGGRDFLVPFRRPLARSEVESGRLRLACLSRVRRRDGPALDVRARAGDARLRRVVARARALGARARRGCSTRSRCRWRPSTPVRGPPSWGGGSRRRCSPARRSRSGSGTTRVVIRDDAVYRSGDNTILVPENESSGQAVRQVSNYVDRKGDWCEADERADAAALAEAIALLRSTNPAGAFLRLIAEARPERYPSLRGRRFTVEVGETPQRASRGGRGLRHWQADRLPASGRASKRGGIARSALVPGRAGRQAKESRQWRGLSGSTWMR